MTTMNTTAGHGLGESLRAFAAQAATVAAMVASAISAARDYDRLRILPDETLAARGLTRQTLPNHVFEQHFGA